MNKAEIISYFNLTKTEIDKTDFFINSIISHNQHTNLIGRSTIESMWNRHILDCLQLTKHIDSKSFKILDMGTGPGLPGLLFSIIGYHNVLMIESTKKKADFVKSIINELSLPAKIQNKRIEKTTTSKNDIIVARALAPLKKLLSYTRMHSNKNTTSLFLKGRNVNVEIKKAMETFLFDFKIIKSISGGDGHVLQIKNLKTKND